MFSTKATSLLGQGASQDWHMPISPSDYPNRNPFLSEEERKGVERLLSFSSWQWKAFDQQLAQLSRITKPLLDVVLLFQRWHPRRPTWQVFLLPLPCQHIARCLWRCTRGPA